MSEPGNFNISVFGCQRCGHDHIGLKFAPLPNAVDEWKWWAMCPTTLAPVLLKIEESES